MKRGRSVFGIGAVVIVTLMAGGASLLEVSAQAAEDTHWFVSFTGVSVPPVQRSDTTQLIDAGYIDTDGFADLVFSLGGEFKEGIPASGTVGVVLIPDIEVFQYLLRSEGQFVFPLEATYDVRGLSNPLFISEQQRAKVAFPRYRVYLYNETHSGVNLSLYVYRTR